jgi:sugar lactone lactonase YvrE
MSARKKVLITVILILFLLSSAAVYFIVIHRETVPAFYIIGEAEAVAITPVTILDGLWNPNNVLDELYNPIGIAIKGTYLVVADSMCDRIQILDGGRNQRIGMPGRFGFAYNESGAFIDGFLEHALFMKPSGVFITDSGDILVSDTGNHAIRMIRGEFVITLAGNGIAGHQDGMEGQATFNQPRAAVMCAAGYVYVADTMNHTIRRIAPNGNVNVYAGVTGASGFIDGILYEAKFFEPSGLYLTDEGILYVADSANHAIRRIENGIVSTVAGQPGAAIRFSDYFEGGYIDGYNDEARFNFPRDIALLPCGSLIVADSLNHAIRLITPESTRTLVGSGVAGNFGDSVENLQLTRPEGVATNGETLYISDTMNNRVLAVPLTERLLAGRPSRGQMLAETGLSINSRFSFRGDVRVFMGSQRADMGRVQPWVASDAIFVPVRPLLEAMGAEVFLNERTGELSITIGNQVTMLTADRDYFIMRGVMVTTLHELNRLFPYIIEWFPELNLLTFFVPHDLKER